MTEIPAVFTRVEVLRGLSDDQLQQLTTISQRQQYDIGHVVFEKGDAATKMYIIDQGQVAVQMVQSDGQTVAAVYLGTGQVFGEMALLDQTSRSAAIVVVEAETALYEIANEDFLNLCTTDTGIGYIMMRNLAQDLSFKLRHRDSTVSS